MERDFGGFLRGYKLMIFGFNLFSRVILVGEILIFKIWMFLVCIWMFYCVFYFLSFYIGYCIYLGSLFDFWFWKFWFLFIFRFLDRESEV